MDEQTLFKIAALFLIGNELDHKKVNIPGKLPSTLIALVDRAHVFPIALLRARVRHTLDNVSVAFLALVVPLDHEVRQVRHERPAESTGSGGEVD